MPAASQLHRIRRRVSGGLLVLALILSCVRFAQAGGSSALAPHPQVGPREDWVRLALPPLLQPPVVNAPPPAGSPVDGISDQNLARWYGTDFGIAVFGRLWASGQAPRIRYARYVVPWQAGATPVNPYRAGFYSWRESALRAGLRTDLAITLYTGRVPTAAQYRSAVASLLADHGVEYLEAWNEPNHLAQLRADEALAPEYMREAVALCALGGCEGIAGDFLDESGSAAFASRYRQRLAALGVSAHLWGIHPYADVNAAGQGGSQPGAEAMAIAAQLGPGDRLWITEAGAYYCFAPRFEWESRVARERQRAAAQRLVDVVAPDLGAEHVFYYGLFAGRGRSLCPTEDTDLYDAREALRPAGTVILGE